MNAYELADELKSCIDDGSTDLVCVCGAVNMLRQQADRIAELEKECRDLIWSYESSTPQTKPLSDEEMYEILYKTDWSYDPIQFGRAIEERHGIK